MQPIEPQDIAMASSAPPEEPGVVPGPDEGPSLIDSPSSDSSEGFVEFNPRMMPPDEQCMDYSKVWPGDWQDGDTASLRLEGWTMAPIAEITRFQSYVPYWSRPNWDPKVERTINGREWRAVRGDALSTMRPILGEGDDIPSRTEYTKRWGINPAMPQTSSGEARSGLTPTGIPGNVEGERVWTHEESWQSYIFDGFTTQELIDTGVYAPEADVPVSDLPASCLNPLFRREKWAQPLVDVGIGGGGSGIRNLNMDYNLGRGVKKWDAATNDELWDAMQPSIRLASKILETNNPYLLMFFRAPFHMRKVPRQYDGRTPGEKMAPNYREYRTLYPDLDQNLMYDNAKALFRLGFDPGVATRGILDNSLAWGFYENQPPKNGVTFTGPDSKIRILLNANNIWPLLLDDYSESEKVGIRVKFASTIVHELVHACHHAHNQMYLEPQRVLANIDGITIDEQIEGLLKALKVEAIGSGRVTDNGRQYFIENDISMEEGKAWENRLWGILPEYHPPLSQQLQPMLVGRGWPYTHPEVYHQDAESARGGAYRDFTKEPYKTWLLFPRAPVYELCTPIPLLNYAHLLQSSWWDNNYIKYGNEALKISSTRADQTYPLQSTLAFRITNFKALLVPLVGNKAVVQFLFVTGPSILRAQNQHLIYAWLLKTSLDLAGSKIMRLRLHYERNTWDDKYGNIQARCNQIIQDLMTANDNVQGYISSGSPVLDVLRPQLKTALRQDLVQLHGLVDYEGRYSQTIAGEYFLKDLDDRRLVRRSMHRLLVHLQTTHDRIVTVLEAMMTIWQGMAQDASFTEQVQDCESLYGRIAAAQTAISAVIGILRGNTLGERSGPDGCGPLAAIPIAMREWKNGRTLRMAALKQLAQITDPALRRCIQTWINIMNLAQDIRNDAPDAEDVVVGGGSMAALKRATDQTTADALGISYLERQDQMRANRTSGREEEKPEDEDEVTADMEQQMDELEHQSDVQNLFSRSFSADEQDRLKRRRGP